MIEIRIIDEKHRQDINIPNEPFSLYGRMIPSYVNEQWGYRVVYFDNDSIGEMCFPDENYDYYAMQDDHTFIGAYDGDKCIGLAILRDALLKYIYLHDLKIAKDYRRQGIAHALIEKAKEICREKGYCGIYAYGQDNNLTACKFYIKSGFYIGGFDSNAYKGTSQAGTADITFYLDCQSSKVFGKGSY